MSGSLPSSVHRLCLPTPQAQHSRSPYPDASWAERTFQTW